MMSKINKGELTVVAGFQTEFQYFGPWRTYIGYTSLGKIYTYKWYNMYDGSKLKISEIALKKTLLQYFNEEDFQIYWSQRHLIGFTRIAVYFAEEENHCLMKLIYNMISPVE